MRTVRVDFKDFKKTSRTPVLTYCRKLIEDGEDPKSRLECYRGGRLDLVVKEIGLGAKLTVLDSREAGPKFTSYKEFKHG